MCSKRYDLITLSVESKGRARADIYIYYIDVHVHTHTPLLYNYHNTSTEALKWSGRLKRSRSNRNLSLSAVLCCAGCAVSSRVESRRGEPLDDFESCANGGLDNDAPLRPPPRPPFHELSDLSVTSGQGGGGGGGERKRE